MMLTQAFMIHKSLLLKKWTRKKDQSLKLKLRGGQKSLKLEIEGKLLINQYNN